MSEIWRRNPRGQMNVARVLEFGKPTLITIDDLALPKLFSGELLMSVPAAGVVPHDQPIFFAEVRECYVCCRCEIHHGRLIPAQQSKTTGAVPPYPADATSVETQSAAWRLSP